MAKRRGFFAEMQHQAAVAERNRQRAHVAAVREAQRQQREAERAQAAAQRARTAAARADAKAQAEAEREAKRLHVAAREAEVEALNADLAAATAEIDSILSWTLDVDDHVDLEDLRQVVEHPPFISQHQSPIPAPPPVVAPPEPALIEPPPPSGIGAVFGKKKHAQAIEQARAAFAQQYAVWQAVAATVPMRQLEQAQAYQAAEAERLAKLAADAALYDDECEQRQAQVDQQNNQLDQLIAGLRAGEKDAVEEYFGIVFGNSVYPDSVAPEVECSYGSAEKELEVTLRLPKPKDIPGVRAYRYIKARDEISETALTAKEQRDRYANLVHSIVLRTLHEVWESDRLGHVATISLTAGVEHTDPATGRQTFTPLAAVAAHRADFERIDLAHVTPVETIKYLKGVVSKNPYALAPIQLPDGVRG